MLVKKEKTKVEVLLEQDRPEKFELRTVGSKFAGDIFPLANLEH
jgi:hypothetical protein